MGPGADGGAPGPPEVSVDRGLKDKRVTKRAGGLGGGVQGSEFSAQGCGLRIYDPVPRNMDYTDVAWGSFMGLYMHSMAVRVIFV